MDKIVICDSLIIMLIIYQLITTCDKSLMIKILDSVKNPFFKF